MHVNVSSLPLKKVWDDKDVNLFNNHRFTAAGLRAYWEAVDKTTRYFDSVILKKNANRKNQAYTQAKQPTLSQKDKFRWQNPNLNLHSVLLPAPLRH